MISKVELKLHRVLNLIHKLKLKLIKNKKVTLTEINDIYNRLDIIYDTMSTNKKDLYKGIYDTTKGSLSNMDTVQ
jgi:hypothetical protein